jgi:PAS domain S-box-containing protein
MRRRSFYSSRIGLIVLVSLALLPMLGLILYSGAQQRQVATRQAKESIFNATQQFSSEYGHLVEGAHQMLVALSQVGAIRNQDFVDCQILLSQLRKQFPQYANIGNVDKDGTIVCSAVPGPIPTHVNDRTYFQRAVQTRDFSTGDFQVGRITGRKEITFGYPIIGPDGSVRGVVFASLDLLWLPQLAKDISLPDGAAFSLVDRQGTILERLPNPDQWIGKQLGDPSLLSAIQGQAQGTTEGMGVDGVQRIVGFIRLIDDPGQQTVTVLVSEPSTQAYAEANRTLTINLIGLAVIALIAISAAWGGAYLFLLRQISGIVQATHRLGAGDLTTRSGSHFMLNELRDLGLAFDEMAEALQRQRTELETTTLALRQSEAHYRSLVEMSPEAIYIYSEGKIAFINETGAHMLGFEKPELLIGKEILEFIHPDSKGIASLRLHQLMEGRQELPLLEERMLRADGSPFDVEVTASPVVYQNLPAALVVIREITEQKQAEAARRRRTEEMEALYETSLELTSQLDLTALLAGISERASRLLRAQIGAVYLLSLDGLSLELVAGQNLPEGLLGARLQLGEGASGIAAQKGELTQVDDYQAFANRSNQYAGHSFRRVLAMPIKVRGQVIGVITVTDEEQTGVYGPEETRLAQLFADQAAIAVENARLYETAQRELAERQRSEEAQRRLVAELSALHAVSLAGIEASDLDELTERVTHTIGEQFYPDDFGIGFLDQATQSINFHSSYRIRTGNPIPNIHLGEGVSGWVALHRKPRSIADVRAEADYMSADPEIRSELCVPILHGDQLLGIINAESRQLAAFSQADERLLTALAGEVGIAIEKLRLIGQERRRRQEAETLRASTAALTSTLDLGRVIEQLLDCIRQVVPYDSTSVMLLSQDCLEITAQRGFRDPIQSTVLSEVSQVRHISEVLECGHPVIIPNTWEDPRWIRNRGGTYIRCWMGVPLVVKDKVIGVINLDKAEPGFYHAEDAELALAFANQAAAAIENARLYEAELQRSRELAAVGRVSEALRAAPTPAEMMPIIVDQVVDLLGAQAAGLMMIDSEAEEVRMELCRGLWAAISGDHIPLDTAFITRKVLDSGQPYLNNDIPSTPDLYQFSHFQGLQAVYCVPLIMRDITTGILEVGRSTPFGEREMHLIAAIGELSANALHRAQLHDQTVQRLKRLTILRKVDMAITASMDYTFTLNILLEEMLTGLHLDAADVLLFNSNVHTLEWAAGKGFDSTASAHARLSFPTLSSLNPDVPQVRSVMDRLPVLIEDLSLVKTERARLLAQDGFVSGMVLPLISKGEVKGLMEVFQRSTLTRDRETIDFIESLAGQAAISLDNAQLFDNLERSNLELSLAYDATIEGWARALDLRSEDTEKHSYRVVEKTLELARVMDVNDNQMVHIRRGAFLHDIGKIAVPDDIMNKPGPLTAAEWEIMRMHPVHGYQLLSPIAYLHPAIEIPYYHHEKWDGSGYPHGLRGEEIPLAARIFAIVDVWDALLNDRPYRKAWSEERVREYLREQSGKHFDPRVVDAFFRLQEWG